MKIDEYLSKIQNTESIFPIDSLHKKKQVIRSYEPPDDEDDEEKFDIEEVT